MMFQKVFKFLKFLETLVKTEAKKLAYFTHTQN